MGGGRKVVRRDTDLGFGEKKRGGFNVILMNMAIMDVATLEPMVKALPLLLAEDGV